LRAIDPIDPRGFKEPAELFDSITKQPAEGLELIAMCLNAGLYREANLIIDRTPPSPMVDYYRGRLSELEGQAETAKAHYAKAAARPMELQFPFQLEMAEVLRGAMAANPRDAKPPYYLGLLLYDRQPAEAVKLWTKASELDPKLAVAQRNLAVAYARAEGGVPKAIAALEKAVALNGSDALYLFELDRLYEFSQESVEKRLALFESHAETTRRRDDSMSRLVTLQVLAGKYDEALAAMSQRHFHLWEGGARFNVQDTWTDAYLLRGARKLAAGDAAGALKDFAASVEYPENLEVTRAYRGSRAVEAYYYQGLALEALGQKEEARRVWRQSAAELLGSDENPHPTVESGAALLYYQARSLEKLGEAARAKRLFEALKETAAQASRRDDGTEFFAKFGEQRSPRLRAAQAHYVAGLAALGLGDREAALKELRQAVELNRYLVAARAQLATISK